MSLRASFDINGFRQNFSLRLGEIIENVIGDARLRELFDDAEGHPEDYEGKPTGLIALDMGVITPNTKTALLVAQAAERTARLADQIIEVSVMSQDHLDDQTPLDPQAAGRVAYDDPVFKFVGSDRDPEILQQAQATWQIAQMALNKQIAAVNDSITNPGADIPVTGPGGPASLGLKEAAAQYYQYASLLMEGEGHQAAADKMYAVSQQLDGEVIRGEFPSPSVIASALKSDQLSRDFETQQEPSVAYVETLERLAGLAKPAAAKLGQGAGVKRRPKQP